MVHRLTSVVMWLMSASWVVHKRTQISIGMTVSLVVTTARATPRSRTRMKMLRMTIAMPSSASSLGVSLKMMIPNSAVATDSRLASWPIFEAVSCSMA